MTVEMREKLIYQQGIKSLIETCQKYQVTYENIKADLMEQYGLQEEKAEEYMQKYFRVNI